MYNDNDKKLMEKYSPDALADRIEAYLEDFGNSSELEEILTELLHDCHNSPEPITGGMLQDTLLLLERATELEEYPTHFGTSLGTAVETFLQDLRKGE